MQRILDRLECQQTRESTSANYHTIWRQFNKFLLRLDRKPKFWEERAALFAAYKIEHCCQSASIKSYISAIKRVLVNDKYKWNDSLIMVSSLTRACKLVNDRVKTRLLIQASLLEMLLFEIDWQYRGSQFYLKTMYKALFSIGYYGLLRTGELIHSPHVIKAKDVHMGLNKEKILIVLYSSKIHTLGSRPQKIKISSIKHEMTNKNAKLTNRHFCPF